MKPIVYRRSGFNPCCERHVEYKPCDCIRWGVRFVDQDGNEIPVGGEGPSPSIDEDPPSTEHF
jgi:hypothetical protein